MKNVLNLKLKRMKMDDNLKKILNGYTTFREKYASGDQSVMGYLSKYGQSPKAMVIACCDSRVDPALILQCDPGDLFVVRNVANIVPPFEKDVAHHGTSAALEFGICFLNIQHLILLGHSQCGGIQAFLNTQNETPSQDDFITNWVSIIKTPAPHTLDVDDCAKMAVHHSYENCMTFPWIKERFLKKELVIHQWFFDIKMGQIFAYSACDQAYKPLDVWREDA